MHYYLLILVVLLVVCIAMMLFNKDAYEKILVFNQLSSLVTLAIAMLASYKYYQTYLDIAIIYSFFSFVAINALLYYLKVKRNNV